MAAFTEKMNISLPKESLVSYKGLRHLNQQYSSPIVNIIECIIIGLSFINLVYFVHISFKCKTLHKNFRILCFNDCLGSLVLIVLRSILIIDLSLPVLKECFADDTLKLLYYFYDGMIQFSVFNLAAILFERWWSTICARNYESYFRFTPIFILSLFPWLATFSLIIIIQILSPEIFCFIVLAINFLFVTGFIILFIYNRQLLKRHEHKTLSHAFQVRENIRTIKLMSILGSLVTAHIAICIIIVCIAHEYDYCLKTLNLLVFWRNMLYVFFATRAFILPNVVRYLFLRNRQNMVQCANTQSGNDQRTLYFNELRRQWGIQ